MFVETNIADSPVGLFVVGIGVVDSTRPVREGIQKKSIFFRKKS